MDLHALGQQVSRRFVADLIQQREDPPGGTRDSLLARHQLPDHVFGSRHTLFFLD
ncbi:hypothetical protein D3C75_1148170 [compost metagenome]